MIVLFATSPPMPTARSPVTVTLITLLTAPARLASSQIVDSSDRNSGSSSRIFVNWTLERGAPVVVVGVLGDVLGCLLGAALFLDLVPQFVPQSPREAGDVVTEFLGDGVRGPLAGVEQDRQQRGEKRRERRDFHHRPHFMREAEDAELYGHVVAVCQNHV